jgi:SagB-type dehydrogenase family enzyme
MYHEHSKHRRDQAPQPPDESARPPIQLRTYPGSERVRLPGRDFALPRALGRVLSTRRSIRQFAPRPLSLVTAGRLLYASYGVRGVRRVGGSWLYDRPVPSAGGLYPLELYVATQAVSGLVDGVYHYDPRAHEFELRRRGLVHREVAKMVLAPEAARTARLIIMIAASFRRTMWKYGERGYRYVFLDAGHLGQNLYLAATALRIGALGLGGFFDEEINELAGLVHGDEEVIYVVCAGRPRFDQSTRRRNVLTLGDSPGG